MIQNRSLILFAVVSALLFVMLLTKSSDPSEGVPLSVHNCVSGTWVGAVKWDDENKRDYKDTDIELKKQGTVVFIVEPGLYAFTHYRPMKKIEHGPNLIIIPAKILDFKEIEVKDKPVFISFGCN